MSNSLKDTLVMDMREFFNEKPIYKGITVSGVIPSNPTYPLVIVRNLISRTKATTCGTDLVTNASIELRISAKQTKIETAEIVAENIHKATEKFLLRNYKCYQQSVNEFDTKELGNIYLIIARYGFNYMPERHKLV